MKKISLLLFSVLLLFTNCLSDRKTTESTNSTNEIEAMEDSSEKESTVTEINTTESEVTINPISHGTLVLEYKNIVFYIDPVGGAEAFENQKKATLILVTDIHADHLNNETLEAISNDNSKIIVPIAVKEKLTETLKKKASVVSNFQSIDLEIGDTKINIEAIPMYNLREEALKFHTKDRGNGYVLTLGDERVYISGDTEDIPEMRKLKDIDIAFVCMNLPYTMTVESAASAVLDFKPKQVYPYHYRGTKGLSDVGKFKDIVNDANPEIKVIQLDWYPNRDSK